MRDNDRKRGIRALKEQVDILVTITTGPTIVKAEGNSQDLPNHSHFRFHPSRYRSQLLFF